MNKLPAIFFALPLFCAYAEPQTVDDSACPHYAADIASFATCEGDQVVKPTATKKPDASVTAPDKKNTKVDHQKNHTKATNTTQQTTQQTTPAGLGLDADSVPCCISSK